MKRILKYLLPVVLLICGGVAYMTFGEGDPDGLSAADKTFLLDAANSRRMEWAQGNLAAEKGTLVKFRQYGKRLMRDQDRMMQEIKTLAANKDLELPETLTDENMEALNKLKAYPGKSFDRRFRRMLISTHKRDIREFQRAAESADPEISAFAKRYLPVLESQLEQARALNK